MSQEIYCYKMQNLDFCKNCTVVISYEYYAKQFWFLNLFLVTENNVKKIIHVILCNVVLLVFFYDKKIF